MNKSTLLFSLAGLGLVAWLVTRRSSAGQPATFGTSSTAKPPQFFGLSGFQVPLISAKPGGKAEAYASAIGSTVNSFGGLARAIWAPNKDVPSRGAGRSDSASEPVPVQATSYQLSASDYNALDFSYPNYGEPGSPGPSSDVTSSSSDSFGI